MAKVRRRATSADNSLDNSIVSDIVFSSSLIWLKSGKESGSGTHLFPPSSGIKWLLPCPAGIFAPHSTTIYYTPGAGGFVNHAGKKIQKNSVKKPSNGRGMQNFVNSQSKFHSWKAPEITMRKGGNKSGKERKNTSKAREKSIFFERNAHLNKPRKKISQTKFSLWWNLL